MSPVSLRIPRSNRWSFSVLILAALALVALPSLARGQDVISREAAAVVKAAYVADIEVMRGKFVGLAQAFPADKYTWRPMEGVRSVSEVLMLIASETYGFAPTALGGKAAFPREEMAKLSKITDKAQVIEHLNKGFAHAKPAIEAVDPATLVGKLKLFGQERSAVEAVMFVSGDMHEHLGQLIAYARMNGVVPPWSK